MQRISLPSPAQIILTILLAMSATLPSTARADDWPTRPLTLIVPFPAGGG
jgi:tripartite-type tricarboxylate transporter receptor subunit TctC